VTSDEEKKNISTYRKNGTHKRVSAKLRKKRRSLGLRWSTIFAAMMAKKGLKSDNAWTGTTQGKPDTIKVE